jgi:hypothetical protein
VTRGDREVALSTSMSTVLDWAAMIGTWRDRDDLATLGW